MPSRAPEVAAESLAAPGFPAWKESLAAGRENLRQHYLASPASAVLLRRHRTLVDKHLLAVWQHLAMPSSLALVAVGGYGRGELFPFSDIDILVLLPQTGHAGAAEKLEQFVSIAWDVGLAIGHSVRSVEECVTLAAADVTIQTNLLEARLLAGEARLFDRFQRRFRAALDTESFCNAKRLEQEQRHARYRDTNLEPNIKETAGGLRDLHHILWIAKATGTGAKWADLVRRDIITGGEARQLRQHESFLQDLRIRLHYLTNRREERLVFDVQTALAGQFGLHDTAHRLASEHLMQRFYRTAKEIQQINTVVLRNLGLIATPAPRRAARRVSPDFRVRDELLEARDEGLFRQRPGAMFEAVVLLQKHPELKGMSAKTLRALWRASNRINPAFRANRSNRALFMEILRSPTHVARGLALMNQYGMLGRYIPAFGRIVGQMQHDLYHVYTVDEHILNVIRNLRRFVIPELAHEFPLCSRLMGDVEHPELLYLAGLFHDIAKGRGGDHSTLGGAEAGRFCRAHGLARKDVEFVAWLVEHHLLMSVTAQKQDLSDPAVIEAFAAKVGDERRLEALYLLTVADIRGTSPKVWNAWKGKLLEDLFHATSRRLSGNLQPLDIGVRHRQDAARAKLRLYAIAEHAHEKLWAQLDVAYFLRHDPDEIAWHTRLLNYRVETATPVVKARLSRAGEGLQVMIYVRDQKELFARICSFFERSSYSIMEARIYTTRHGYALDTFQINDPNNKRPQYRDMISYIEFELADRLTHHTPLEPLTQGRVSRQLRHFPITPQVNIESDEKGQYKVLQILAGDRPGLLSRIARCLVKYGINLQTAKINTLGDRAEDAFLIQGDALYDSKTIVKLESELVQQLQ